MTAAWPVQVYKDVTAFPAYLRNQVGARHNRGRFQAAVRQRQADLKDKELAVTLEYRELHEEWREYFYSES